MAIRTSPKNIAIAVLGAAVIGLGTVVAVDRTTSAAPARPATVAARTQAAPPSLIDTAAGTPAGRQAMANRIAQLFGLTPDQLKADIQSGQTLDQIAGAKDQTIKQEILGYLNMALDKAAAKGAITPEQQSSLQHDAGDALTQLFAAQLGKLGSGG